MEWLLELNRSLDYIEEQLEGNMQLEQIAGEAAKIARCSAYHYQRIFSYLDVYKRQTKGFALWKPTIF